MVSLQSCSVHVRLCWREEVAFSSAAGHFLLQLCCVTTTKICETISETISRCGQDVTAGFSPTEGNPPFHGVDFLRAVFFFPHVFLRFPLVDAMTAAGTLTRCAAILVCSSVWCSVHHPPSTLDFHHMLCPLCAFHSGNTFRRVLGLSNVTAGTLS